MSTGGKVLVVLVLLVVPVWIVLVSAVAELNASGTQAVAKLKDDVAKLEKEVADNETKIESLQDEIGLEQDAMTGQTTVLREKLTDVERQRSETIELQSRAKLQLETMNAAVQTATAARDQRNAEKLAETKAKTKFEADVTTLQGENAALMDQLAQLRGDFKKTLEDNKKKLTEIQSRSAQTRQSAPASFRTSNR